MPDRGAPSVPPPDGVAWSRGRGPAGRAALPRRGRRTVARPGRSPGAPRSTTSRSSPDAFRGDIFTDFVVHRGELRALDRRGVGLMAWVLRGLREGVVTIALSAATRRLRRRVPRRGLGRADSHRGDRPTAETTSPPLCPTGAIATRGGSPGSTGAPASSAAAASSGPTRPFSPSTPPPRWPRSARQALIVPHETTARSTRSATELARRVRSCAGRSTSATSTPGPTAPRSGRSLRSPTRSTTSSGSGSSSPPPLATPTCSSSPAPARPAWPIRCAHLRGDARAQGRARRRHRRRRAAASCARATPGASGIGAIVPVDVWVPGSPPSPFSLLHGILLGIGLVAAAGPPA